ncbi:MAG: preprotein translocase subunit YajC, partial [Acutalibacteraceae bacterium]|nr:preprotein translocase subunit YajC [Acutalibacteraceae bacterium]
MDFALLLNTASGASAGDTGAALGSSGFMIVILLFFVVYMWMMSRREKKNRNEEQAMRDSLKVGDEVVTIGGILGKVVSVKDET